jgi:hypothetical protein
MGKERRLVANKNNTGTAKQHLYQGETAARECMLPMMRNVKRINWKG